MGGHRTTTRRALTVAVGKRSTWGSDRFSEPRTWLVASAIAVAAAAVVAGQLLSRSRLLDLRKPRAARCRHPARLRFEAADRHRHPGAHQARRLPHEVRADARYGPESVLGEPLQNHHV